jgi:hypothetical protein
LLCLSGALRGALGERGPRGTCGAELPLNQPTMWRGKTEGPPRCSAGPLRQAHQGRGGRSKPCRGGVRSRSFGFGLQEGSPYLHGAQAPATSGGSKRPWLPLPESASRRRNAGQRAGQRRGGRTRAAGGTTLFRVGRYRRFCNIVKTPLSTKFVDFRRSASERVPPSAVGR